MNLQDVKVEDIEARMSEYNRKAQRAWQEQQRQADLSKAHQIMVRWSTGADHG